MAPPLTVALDVTPLQNGHRHRGVGNYVRGLLTGLAQIEAPPLLLHAWADVPVDLRGIPVPRGAAWRRIRLPPLGRLSTLVGEQVVTPFCDRGGATVFHKTAVVADATVGGVPWSFVNHTVVTVHDLIPLRMPEAYLHGKTTRRVVYRLMLELVRRCSRIVVDSQATSADVQTLLGISNDRIAVVPLAPAPQLEGSTGSDGLPRTSLAHGRYFLAVAPDEPSKGLRYLVEGFASFCRAGRSSIDLVIVGRPSESLLEAIAVLGVSGRIVFRSNISDGEISALYRGALATVVPSLFEGFGLPALEAMALGSPVVASDADAVLEVTRGAGLTYPARDSDALADALRAVARSPSLRDELSSLALARAARYSWRHTAELTVAAYSAAASQSAQRRSLTS